MLTTTANLARPDLSILSTKHHNNSSHPHPSEHRHSTQKDQSGLEGRQPHLSVAAPAFAMFLVKSIEKIAAERETKKSQNATLRTACSEALHILNGQPNNNDLNKKSNVAIEEPSSDHLPPLRSDSTVLLTDEKILKPFQLACSMKSAKIVTTAVDSLQKLIAYGHVPNDAVGLSGNVRIIEQVVTTICSCFQGVHTDDGIQLQVLKALLTVVTSSVVEIHEADLLLIVRTCYNIFMATKNPVNQATARATLTQIINVIFLRMEQNALEAAVALAASPDSPANCHTDSQLEGSETSLTENHVTASEVIQRTESETELSGEDAETADVIVRSILDEIIQHPALGNAEENGPPLSPSSDVSSNVSPRTENDSKSPVLPVANGVCSDEASIEPDNTNAQPEAVAIAHVTQKDAFLVFRSLCRLATKEFASARATEAKSNAIRSKTLSLQLLLSIFQQPGPLFLSSDIFITAIKQYLCVALIKNGVSTVPEVCELSVNIFLLVLTHFKPHLKRQIEIFFKDVFLDVLESPKSPFEHKWIVVEALRRICADAQCVVDIYLNYDCDMNMTNIFERLTTCLAKLAQGRYAIEPGTTAAQRQAIRASGLECLVLILRCMVDWSQELYVSPESHSFLGVSEPTVPLTATTESPSSSSSGGGGGGISNDTDQKATTATTIKVTDDPEAFESRKAQKDIYEAGIESFNKGKISQGLRLLQEHGLIEDTVEAVAELLRTEERLCRGQIGDFLGGNEPNTLRVMYAYVDQFDFSNKEFLPSMRELLASFRLPGEAQKIDRLMEKFAARYCACNPNNGLFASADTAYVLAFSIIMLTTDLHSAQIKPHHRMTKTGYIRMNRGINDSQDLPESYLADIYDEIFRCQIKLRSEDSSSKLTALDSTTNAARRTIPNTDGGASEVPEANLLDSMNSTYSEFTSATHCEHVRPMFKLAWTPFLAAFSVGLQDCDALDVAHLCLEGIRYAIRIACIFHMEMERDAYVQGLARFTLLLTSAGYHLGSGGGGGGVSSTYGGSSTSGSTTGRRPRSDVYPHTNTMTSGAGSHGSLSSSSMAAPEAMKQKNIDTIRTLITVAQTDGNYLGRAWLEILRCISQLESAHLITLVASVGGGFSSSSSASSGVSNGVPSSILTRAATMATPQHPSSNASPGVHVIRRSPLSHPSAPTLYGNRRGSKHERMAPGSLAAASVDAKKAAVLQEVMGETGSDSVIVAVDKIFTGSIRLDGSAIVEFVKALCQVSREELLLPHPRTFSLQKVVEISYYNMGRIRLQWSRIWEHIGGHFTTAGQSTNEDVAEFVLDSLRQLSMKLIEKGELPNFHFQKEFLRPFVSILDNGHSLSRKNQDMVIRCVSQLVHSQYMNIRSGWTNIFAVLQRVASSLDEAIVDMAFETCNFTVTEVLTNHLHVIADAFQPLVKLLADFSCNHRYPDTAMESIRLIRICAKLVSEHSVTFAAASASLQSTIDQPVHLNDLGTEVARTTPALATMIQQKSQQQHHSPSKRPQPSTESGDVTVDSHIADDDQVWLKGWMPVLCELFRVINSCKLDVRTRSLTVFFDVLKSYGSQFKPLWWRETFCIIFRVFQHFRAPSPSDHHQHHPYPFASSNAAVMAIGDGHSLSSLEQTEWMNTTCNHTLFSVVDVFTQFYDVLSEILLDDIYNQLRWCCLQEHEQLARSGTSCLETLVLSTGKRFTHTYWDRTVGLIVNLFVATVPHQLLTWRPDAVDEPTQHSESTGDLNDDEEPTVPRYLIQARLFADLLIKCVVQYELIQTVDHILFYSMHSRNEDLHYLSSSRQLALASYPAYAAAIKATTVGSSPADQSRNASRRSSSSDNQWTPDSLVDADETGSKPPETLWLGPGGSRVTVGARPLLPDPRGMYGNLSPEHRLTLARCLLESHTFAKQFNSNDEQRNVLFEAGFKVKAKPNLLKQETHSLLCSLRILFQLADEDTKVRDETEELLDRVIQDALRYYHSLVVDGHRQAWDTCLILIVTQLTRLTPATRFHHHAMRLYAPLCDLVAMAGGVSPEVASLVRLFLLRCGAFFLPPTNAGDLSA